MRAIRSVVLAALSVLALIGFMASAQAAGVVTTSGDIVTITFTGTVSSSTDLDGIFGCSVETTCTVDNPSGPEGAGPYGGETYTATFTFDTGVGSVDYLPGTLAYAQGGSSLPPSGDPLETPPSPLVGDATVTVNGETYSLGGGFYAILRNDSAGPDDTNELPNTLFAEVYDSAGNTIFGQVQTTTDPPQFPVSITTSFSADFGQSAYSYINFDCTGGVCAGNIYGDMSVSLVNDSTVPEPSTWVMMAVGFAGLAFAGYRRTKTAAAA